MADRTELEDLTVAELRDLASEADVEGRSSMTKSELVDALADGPTVTPVDAEPEADRPGPGIDPALVEARDALRERETAEADAVEARPVVGGIDDLLVQRRDATRAADETTVSVSEAPSGGQ